MLLPAYVIFTHLLSRLLKALGTAMVRSFVWKMFPFDIAKLGSVSPVPYLVALRDPEAVALPLGTLSWQMYPLQ
jgi:hypothetical protein